MSHSDYNWDSFQVMKGWEGFNNAAINTFNSNAINSFVREIFQNSVDARLEDDNGNKLPLKVEIDYQKINKKTFPSYIKLLNILKKIALDDANIQHEEFFKQALHDFDKEEIGILIYKDFNTTGLSGADDNPKSTFNACVLSEGTSNKDDENSIGSYGIGKNSIFGLSKIRTVIYSSYNDKDGTILQGISKLASYKDSDITKASRIFFGKGPKLNSLRNSDLEDIDQSVKDFFIRTESGLSQFAVCPIKIENWKGDFIKAILKNYWLLIHDGQLEVTLKYNNQPLENISSGKLNGLMQTYFDQETYDPDDSEPKGNPYDYYLCYTKNAPIEQEIHMLGSVKFYFEELPHKKTNRILFVRNGMVIYSDSVFGFGSIGYCGLVICSNRDGNILLKMMEPPEHNRFDPSRLTTRSKFYSENDGLKALKEIKSLIKSGLNNILSKYRKQAEDIPWLNNLISSIKGMKGSGKGNRTSEQSEEETIERISSNVKKKLVFNSIAQNNLISTKDGDETKDGGTPPDWPRPRPNPPRPEPKPGQGPIPGPTPSSKTGIELKYRMFILGKSGSVSKYKLRIASKTQQNKTMKLTQVGDSGTSASFEILNIRTDTGASLTFHELLNKNLEVIGYKINDIPIPSELVLEMNEPYKSTFKLSDL